MKKFLLIGAMLILGATSFSSVISEIEENTTGSGKGSLGLIARGNSVDIANDVYLEIIPTVSAGADGNSLEFNFGDLTPTSSMVLTGKFTAQVLKKEVPVKLSDSTIKVEVKDDEREHKQLKNTAGKTVGTIEYTKVASSGLVNSDLTYNGVITSKVNIGAKANSGVTVTPEGTFLDAGAYVKVTVTNLELPK